ncbi:SET domain protein [Mycena rebaudengoi]|nr:SET domain protein [Mycena rebaudengoi]
MADSLSTESTLHDLKDWIERKGGYVQPHIQFQKVASGFSVVASENLPPDSKIVSCPFDLAITKTFALEALSTLLGPATTSFPLSAWSERQLISSYLCFHWIIGDDASSMGVLAHLPYVKSLPSQEKLRTPLHFTQLELDQFKGSNLYGATVDREREWKEEWVQCRDVIAGVNGKWGDQFTWALFLTASTHLSSRAFPSTLLSQKMSLTSPSNPEPILLPGVDCLNHARAEPVSWVQNYVGNGPVAGLGSTITLTLHKSVAQGAELFNNYGIKPNSELILGYGFSIPAVSNPDDTIVLKIGGVEGGKWEVGRKARGADGVWESVLGLVGGSEPSYEDYLEGAEILADMVRTLIQKLPPLSTSPNVDMRQDVALMLKNYVEGQHDILQDLLEFAAAKEELGIVMAKAEGIDVVLE